MNETILKTEEIKATEEILKTDDNNELKTNVKSNDILKTVTTEIFEVLITEEIDKTEVNEDTETVKRSQRVEKLESVKGIETIEETKAVDGTKTIEETETVKEPRTIEGIETVEETETNEEIKSVEETETVEGNATDNMFIVPAPVIKKIPVINIPNVLKQRIAHDSVMVNTLNKVCIC